MLTSRRDLSGGDETTRPPGTDLDTVAPDHECRWPHRHDYGDADEQRQERHQKVESVTAVMKVSDQHEQREERGDEARQEVVHRPS